MVEPWALFGIQPILAILFTHRALRFFVYPLSILSTQCLPVVDLEKHVMAHKIKLTKLVINNIDKHRPESGKKYLRDIGLTGFGILLSPTSAAYIVEKRDGITGKSVRVTIGKVGLLDLDEARLRAKELLIQIEKGQLEEKKSPLALTFGEALDDYLANRQLREYSIRQYRRDITSNLAHWLALPILEITEDKVLAEYQRIAKRAAGVANKVFAMVHGVLSFAAANPKNRLPDGSRALPFSPCRVLSDLKVRHKLKPRTGHLADEELPLFGAALATVKREDVRDLILFIFLTGVRRNEARFLRWSDLNLLSRKVTLTAEMVKTKQERVVPITAEIEAIIQRRAAVKSQVCDYVFLSPTGTAAICERELRTAICKIANAIGKNNLTVHDLRRSYVTHTSDPAIMTESQQKLLVGHASDITGNYRQTSFSDLYKAAQRATTYLSGRLFEQKDMGGLEDIG